MTIPVLHNLGRGDHLRIESQMKEVQMLHEWAPECAIEWFAYFVPDGRSFSLADIDTFWGRLKLRGRESLEAYVDKLAAAEPPVLVSRQSHDAATRRPLSLYALEAATRERLRCQLESRLMPTKETFLANVHGITVCVMTIHHRIKGLTDELNRPEDERLLLRASKPWQRLMKEVAPCFVEFAEALDALCEMDLSALPPECNKVQHTVRSVAEVLEDATNLFHPPRDVPEYLRIRAIRDLEEHLPDLLSSIYAIEDALKEAESTRTGRWDRLGRAETTLPDGQDCVCSEDATIENGIADSGSSAGPSIQVTEASMTTIEVFVSHSSKDREIAHALIDLLRTALNLSAEAIRCTSVQGYKLSVGADTDEELKREIQESRALIGLITEVSFESAYVLFELGARWGAGKHMAPLLAAGTSANVLKGPIGGKNALSCDSPGDLHQLISDMAVQLQRNADQPASYQDKLERLIDASETARRQRNETQR